MAPALGEPSARERVGVAPGGDVTMAIDEIAEHVVEASCVDAGDIAFYSEDRGYVEIGRPRATLVVDPIDGTRPAAAGLESCCVSVAVLPPSLEATLGDVAELATPLNRRAPNGDIADYEGERERPQMWPAHSEEWALSR